MKREGIKNMVIGFLMGVCVMLALGATIQRTEQNGRYMIASGDERTYFVMDTRTGNHWYDIAERTGYQGSPREWKAEPKRY